MFQKIAEINVEHHVVQVGRTDHGNISIFKCDNNHCDWELFPDAHKASDFVLEKLPSQYYRVTFEGQDEEWQPITCKAYK